MRRDDAALDISRRTCLIVCGTFWLTYCAAPSQSSVEPSHGDQPLPSESPQPKL